MRPVNKYKRKIKTKEELKPIDRLLFTRGKQWYQLYCRYLYSSFYLTRYDVLIDLRKGTLEYWNVTSKRLVAIDIFDSKKKSYKKIASRLIKRRLSPLGVKFSRKTWNIKNDKIN